MTPDRTAAAIEARRRGTQQKLQQVRDAITDLRRRKTAVTYPAVARRAAVSRTFLYENAEARALIGEAIGTAASQQAQARAGADARNEASWRERALNAEATLTTAHAEIGAQRDRIAVLMGQIRDLEHEWSQETAQRITTENTTLKQRVRQLTTENRTLAERLRAARSDNRFADRRIAQLEAQLAEHAPPAETAVPDQPVIPESGRRPRPRMKSLPCRRRSWRLIRMARMSWEPVIDIAHVAGASAPGRRPGPHSHARRDDRFPRIRP